MRPTPSLITQLQNGAQLWASGTFRGFEDWVAEREIEFVVNLLGRRVVEPMAEWEQWDMNGGTHQEVEWLDALMRVVTVLTTALYSAKHVLVHCQHGLRRTGSLIAFWLALGLVSQEGVTDIHGWHDKLSEAWRTWALGRDLRQATADDRRGRDYEHESWNAVLEFFGAMDVDIVRQMAEDLPWEVCYAIM